MKRCATKNVDPPRPRVCVAVRWRESRTWEGHGAAAQSASPSSLAPQRSRLRVLRRRDTTVSPPHTVPGGVHIRCREAGDPATIVGVGLAYLHQSLTPAPKEPLRRDLEVVVVTPLVAVEGLSTLASPSSSEDRAGERGGLRGEDGADRERLSASQAESHSPLHCSDAHLASELSELIAAELMGPLNRPMSSIPPRRKGMQPLSCGEVLTFAMGLQGSGKTSFLLGGVQGGEREPSSCAVLQLPQLPESTESTNATGGLFRSVLDRLFSTSQLGSVGSLVVAMSVIEVRDAAPLKHPSVLQRPQDTVDLLSGQQLHHEERCGRERSKDELDSLLSASSSSSSSVADQPTDIPAACYVRVQSSAEAAQVLYAALLSSVAWQPSSLPGTGGIAHSPSVPPLLRPAGLLREEKTSHLCITVLVGRHADPRKQDALAFVGIWKLWDLAGPSPSCGYRPLMPHSDKDSVAARSRAPESEGDVGDGARSGISDDNVPPTLPWHNRYSLPSLTHTCLASFGCHLKQHFELDTPALHCDTTALQIAASAVASCTLVTPVCTAVGDAAVDNLNAEVLRCADGWSVTGRRIQGGQAKETSRRTGQVVEPTSGEENALAARRVLEEYTVSFADFITESLRSHHHEATSAAMTKEVWPTSNTNSGATVFGIARAPTADPPVLPLPTGPSASQAHKAALSASLPSSAHSAPVIGEVVEPSGVAGKVVPLSINVTAVDDDSAVTLRMPAAMSGADNLCTGTLRGQKKFSPKAVISSVAANSEACSQKSPPATSAAVAAVPETGSVGLVGAWRHPAKGNETQHDESTRPPVTAARVTSNPLSSAAVHTAEAPHAQEIRTKGPQSSFVTDSSAACDDEPSWTSHEVQVLVDNEGYAGHEMVAAAVPVNDKKEEEETTASQQHQAQEHTQTPDKKDGSPPSVMSTGVRAPASAGSSSLPTPSIQGDPHCTIPSQPPHSEAAAMPNDREQTLAFDPKVLRFDTSELPHEQAQLAEAERGDVGLSPKAATRQPDVASAAIVQYLKPYCDQFTALYAEMRHDVAAWRAAEAESLCALSDLAERHSKDVQQLAELLQKIAAPAQRADVDGAVASSVPTVTSGYDAAAFASTSALIFEQLVKSEEKVAWLERQLVQWRQRTHEASSLQLSNIEACDDDGGGSALADMSDAARSADGSGKKPDFDLSVLSDSTSATTGDRTDPTRRHVLQAQRILLRLLQRCGRAYASAQQRSARWQDQLTQEQSSKSALLDRVAELEKELTEYRQRRSYAAASTPPSLKPFNAPLRASLRAAETSHLPSSEVDVSTATCPAPSPNAWLNLSSASSPDQYGGRAFRGSGTDDNSLTTIHVSSRENGGADYFGRSAPSCATPAHISPIQSVNGTALSMPSLPDHHTRGRASPLRTSPSPMPASHMLSSAASSVRSPVTVVPAKLAALLSRAIECDGGFHQSAPGQAATSPPPCAAAAVFDVHVSSASASASTVGGAPPAVSSADDNVRPYFSVAAPASSPPSSMSSATPRAAGPLRGEISWPGEGIHVAERTLPLSHSPAPRAARHAAYCEARYVVPSAALDCNAEADGEGYDESLQGAPRSALQTHGPLAVEEHRRERAYSSDAYPTVALQRLQHAATQLAASAVGLSYPGSKNPDTDATSPESATELLRRTLNETGGRLSQVNNPDGRDVSANGELWQGSDPERLLSTPLYQSIGQLRSASLAVQHEAREAAEREKAYLSTILFSPISTPHRNGG